jgi:hypothetical protein
MPPIKIYLKSSRRGGNARSVEQDASLFGPLPTLASVIPEIRVHGKIPMPYLGKSEGQATLAAPRICPASSYGRQKIILSEN